MTLGNTSLVRARGKSNQVIIRHIAKEDSKLLAY
jgi:hypothetical protein